MMNRRTFLCGLTLGALPVPLVAKAQQVGKVWRIGFLRAGQPPTDFVEAFQQGLRESGYLDGQNVIVEYRFTDGSVDQLPQLAEELVRSRVDVILASAGASAVAAQKATTSIPIIFVGMHDPVEVGIVPSLSRPGGNVTGFALTSADLFGKRLELLRELVPKLRRVAVLSHPANPPNRMQLKAVEVAAHALGVQLQLVSVQSPNDFDSAFKTVRADALFQLDSPFFTTQRIRLVELAVNSRLPAVYGFSEMVDVGGLMSYGAHQADLYRRAATYVDKILKGAKPSDLPVQQPTKFELVVNTKTAKALGLTIPQTLLLQANRVVE